MSAPEKRRLPCQVSTKQARPPSRLIRSKLKSQRDSHGHVTHGHVARSTRFTLRSSRRTGQNDDRPAVDDFPRMTLPESCFTFYQDERSAMGRRKGRERREHRTGKDRSHHRRRTIEFPFAQRDSRRLLPRTYVHLPAPRGSGVGWKGGRGGGGREGSFPLSFIPGGDAVTAGGHDPCRMLRI